MSKMSSKGEERKVFKFMLCVWMIIIVSGLVATVLLQRKYIKTLQEEVAILKNGQNLQDEEGIQIPKKNPVVFRDENGNVYLLI